jgi:hypothetical protein
MSPEHRLPPRIVVHMHVELMRDDAKSFPEVANPETVETLRVWHSKYKTLEPLVQFANLRGLEVATFPDPSLQVLAHLKRLQFLRILHLPNVTDLAPLSELRELVTLHLATLPSWDASSKRTVVESLEPLLRLHKLRHLELLSVVPPDRSLAALEELPRLRTANFHGFPKVEVARFSTSSGIQKAHAPSAPF